MLHIKNIDSNNSTYIEILTENIKVSEQHGANNLVEKPLFNIFKNHYFCAHLNIFHATHEKYRL